MQKQKHDELAIKLFSGNSQFVMGVAKSEQLPDSDMQEFAFAGRSNVGKSSLINSVLGRAAIARTSANPGCTQQLNFYLVAEQFHLVDMPGYGYAKAGKGEIKGWNRLIMSYLKGRRNLKRVFLLVDMRRGVMESDDKVMTALDEAAVSYRVVLTKADSLHPNEQKKTVDGVLAALYKHPAAMREPIITSSRDSIGIDDLRNEICSLL